MGKILVANWKMNPLTEKEAIMLAKASDVKGVVVCPPFPFLKAVKKVLKKAALGAQDAFWASAGAFTGEISPIQLKALGVQYVILGHSERRIHLGETNTMISEKVEAVLAAGLTPILCVGESAAEHDLGNTKEVIEKQMELGLSLVPRGSLASTVILAYEPVWAIGTGKPDDPADANAISEYLFKRSQSLPVRATVIYGGSTNSGDVGRFLNYPAISGALVGGASLNPAEFKKMIALVLASNKK